MGFGISVQLFGGVTVIYGRDLTPLNEIIFFVGLFGAREGLSPINKSFMALAFESR
jgi:hypothetical protein